VRSEVFTVVMQMIEVFWDVMPFFAAVSAEHEELLAE
jgi:hypothetical protein